MSSGRTRPTGRQHRRTTLLATLATLLTSLVFAASASAEGAFVIGDENAAVGQTVTFWGAQWWKLNSLSGGVAPASFKGFADDVAEEPACAGTWTSNPGNSSDPPAAPLAPLIEAIVSSTITKSGRTISGDTTEVVTIATEPGYGPNPGHPGTGTVVAVRCRAGEGEGGSEGGGGKPS